MASRRAGLFGASENERESRLNQQRDYAAQLQEQVRIKNARAEQDKARRQQEQQQEREMMDAQQQQQQKVRRPPEPQLQLTLQQTAPLQQPLQQYPPQQQPSPSPVRSPQRSNQQQQHHDQQYPPYQYQPHEPQVQHGTAMLAGAGSPPKQPWGYTPISTTMGNDASNHFASNSYASPPLHTAPLVTAFSPGASIFDALLQSPETNNSETTRQIDALRQLRLDAEAHWTQRRLAQQSAVASKPCFILPPSPTASTRIPLSLVEKRLLDHEIDLSPRFQEGEQELLSSNNTGLLGESVLIPLAKATMRPPSTISSPLPSPSPPRPPSAVHRRLAAATAAAAASSMATDKCSALDTSSSSSPLCLDHPNSTALRHDSELLHFDQ